MKVKEKSSCDSGDVIQCQSSLQAWATERPDLTQCEYGCQPNLRVPVIHQRCDDLGAAWTDRGR